jgi:hypothetical protein
MIIFLLHFLSLTVQNIQGELSSFSLEFLYTACMIIFLLQFLTQIIVYCLHDYGSASFSLT